MSMCQECNGLTTEVLLILRVRVMSRRPNALTKLRCVAAAAFRTTPGKCYSRVVDSYTTLLPIRFTSNNNSRLVKERSFVMIIDIYNLLQ